MQTPHGLCQAWGFGLARFRALLAVPLCCRAAFKEVIMLLLLLDLHDTRPSLKHVGLSHQWVAYESVCISLSVFECMDTDMFIYVYIYMSLYSAIDSPPLGRFATSYYSVACVSGKTG